MEETKSEIILYETPDGQTHLDVIADEETVWLTQSQLVELFQTSRQNVSLHIKNIFDEGELLEDTSVKEYLTDLADAARSRLNTRFINNSRL